MKKAHLILISILFFGTTQAQVYPQIGARSNGLANASLCLDDVWSVYNNPGAFGMMDKSGVGVSYENRFLLSELSTQALAFGYHTEKIGNFGLHFQQYGFELYREMQGGLTYGMQLFDNFSAGVSVNYHRIRLAENYGSKNLVTAALGMNYAMNEDLQIGFRVQNISRTRLAEFDDERMPTNFALGFKYAFSDKAFWTVEAEKDLIYPVNVKSGIEIQPHDIFAVRLGINTYPFQSAFGFSLKLKSFQLDLATQWHTQLGISPSGGLKFSF